MGKTFPAAYFKPFSLALDNDKFETDAKEYCKKKKIKKKIAILGE